jgi:hypothetical protein
MAKLKLTYSPEAATPREFVVDMGNPPFPLMRDTELKTDWPWGIFQERLENQSAIAWQALLWALRKADEPRLKLEWVTLDWSELDIAGECPTCKGWVSDSDHECETEGDEDEVDEVGDVDPEA